MDWGKVDAPLASALAGASEDQLLPVFILLDRKRAGDDELARLGLGAEVGEGTSASLSATKLAELTDQVWVRRISLSARLRLLDDL